MKRFIGILSIVLVLFYLLVACGFGGGQEPSPPLIEVPVGPSGMTMEQVRSTVYKLEKARMELRGWMAMWCHDDYDESLPAIPDESGNFNWRAVNKYKTVDEFYGAFRAIYAREFAEFEFSFFGSELISYDPATDSTEWRLLLPGHYREFDGRLYVRDDDYSETSTSISYDVKTLEIIEETEAVISFYLYDKNGTTVATQIILENGRWVFSETWHRYYR